MTLEPNKPSSPSHPNSEDTTKTKRFVHTIFPAGATAEEIVEGLRLLRERHQKQPPIK